MSANVLLSGGHIVSVASGALGNSVTTYYYFNCNSQDDKTLVSLNWTITATTLTLEFSNDDLPLGTAPNAATATQLAALNWIDLTSNLTGAANQTTTGSLTVVYPQTLKWKFGRVKAVTTNATNVLDVYLNRG